MKKLIFYFFVFFSTSLFAQVGINTTTPNAQLDIRSSNQVAPTSTDGMLIPKVDTFPATNPSIDQQGMLVYLTSDVGSNQPGFYYWDNPTSTWIPIGNNNNSGWSLSGNAGTNSATNFIGTTDNQDLVLRRNNLISGRIGTSNSSFGLNALVSNTGVNNVAIGTSALFSNTLGYENTAIGSSALRLNTTGFYNTANGFQALRSNTSGNTNTAIGDFSLSSNTIGSGNTALGSNSLSSNIVGIQNTAVGRFALSSNLSNDNTAIGTNALSLNTTGTTNTAVGVSALNSNSTASQNSALGFFSLAANTIGFRNTAVGYRSLSSNTTGNDNVALGNNSLEDNTTGNNNTAIGSLSMPNNTTGNRNVAVGRLSLRLNTSGSSNTSIGDQSLFSNTIGGSNISIGVNSSILSSSGFQNIAIGTSSFATNTIGFRNTIIGDTADVATNNLFNSTAIGANAEVGSSNSLILGSINGINGATSNVNVGIGTTTPQDRLHVVGNLRMVDGNQALGRVLTSDANGTATWQNASANAWGLTGNTGTNALNNFIGTTDDVDLVFKRNNFIYGRLGFTNTSFGRNANVGGSDNSSFGSNSMSNANGTLNSAFGANSLVFNSGSRNCAFGNASLMNNISGSENVALGFASLLSNTHGQSNISVGGSSLSNNLSGSLNIAIGINSLFNNLSGNQNVAIGANSLSGVNSSNNTAVGTNSLTGNNGGSNTALGFNALDSFVTGAGNTAIGQNSDVGNFNNATAIGANAFAGASNSLVLGSINGINGAIATVNVGIGTTTPQERLHVAGRTLLTNGFSADNAALLYQNNIDYMFLGPQSGSSANGAAMALYGSTNNNGSNLGGINFSVPIGEVRINHNGGSHVFRANSTSGYSSTFELNDVGLQIGHNSASRSILFNPNNTERMRLTPTGNLGLGTNNPQQKLHVSGPAGLTAIRIGNTSLTGSTSNVAIDFLRGGNANTDWRMYNIGPNLTLGNSGDDLATVNDLYQFQGVRFMPMSDATISLGQGLNRWNTVFASNGTINTSDAREKKNIQNLNYGLTTLMQLRPVSFEWKKDDGSGTKLGLIAQELRQVVPEVVRDWDWEEDEQGNRRKVASPILGVYYSDLIPVLIKATQEQQLVIEQQKEEINLLKQQLQEQYKSIVERLEKIENK